MCSWAWAPTLLDHAIETKGPLPLLKQGFDTGRHEHAGEARFVRQLCVCNVPSEPESLLDVPTPSVRS